MNTIFLIILVVAIVILFVIMVNSPTGHYNIIKSMFENDLRGEKLLNKLIAKKNKKRYD